MVDKFYPNSLNALLLGSQRIRDERNKRRQTARSRSTGSEPVGSARRKIDSGYEFKLNKMSNAFFHVRPYTPIPSFFLLLFPGIPLIVVLHSFDNKHDRVL